jgi:hypothetical protein
MTFHKQTGITIVSGGQTGVDIAALRVAQILGYRTGGEAPAGYKTQAGPRPELKQVFGLTEARGGYAARTRTNLLMTDATLVIATNLDSPGTKLTIDLAKHFEKPLHVLEVKATGKLPPFELPADEQVEAAAAWIAEVMKPAIAERATGALNVAGNSSTSVPGIFVPAFDAMARILNKVYIDGCTSLNVEPHKDLVAMYTKLKDSNFAMALQDNYQRIPDLDPRLHLLDY